MKWKWLSAFSGEPAATQPPSQLLPSEAAGTLRRLAWVRLDLPPSIKPNCTLNCTLTAHGGHLPGFKNLRLAVLGSSTTSHPLPGLRVAGLRRDLLLKTYEVPYNSYRQELAKQQFSLHLFFSQAILFALDAHRLAATGCAEAALQRPRNHWRRAGDHLLRTAPAPDRLSGPAHAAGEQRKPSRLLPRRHSGRSPWPPASGSRRDRRRPARGRPFRPLRRPEAVGHAPEAVIEDRLMGCRILGRGLQPRPTPVRVVADSFATAP